jgi:hypothetical protein
MNNDACFFQMRQAQELGEKERKKKEREEKER